MPNSITLKTCRKCGETFPNTRDHFYKNKNYSDGLTTMCQACLSIQSRDYHKNGATQRTRTRRIVASDGNQICTKCGVAYPRNNNNFEADKKAIGGLKSYCKACGEVMRQNWRDNNREYYLDQKRAWRKANPDKVKAHKSASQKRNRASANIRSRRWRENNPEKTNMWVHRRIAKRHNLPEDYTLEDWKYALDYFNHSCAVCGRPAGFWHVIAKDHWIAINNPDCPGTIPTNIIPLCHAIRDGEAACNNSKGKRLAHDWLSSIYPPAQVRKIEARIAAYFETVRK